MIDARHLFCLERLVGHADRTSLALTGSAAIDILVDVDVRGVQDLDFVASEPAVLGPSVIEAFLVSHYHLPQPGYRKFLIQLVDPTTKLRVDIFPDCAGSLARARALDVGAVRITVLDPLDILDHKVAMLAEASATSRVERKHYEHARRLADHCGRSVLSISEEVLCETTYSQDLTASCPRCEVSRCAEFPLAPKQAIHDLLGYV